MASLAEAIKLPPETMIKLNLHYNNLKSMNFATFRTLITNLPQQLRSLNLSANNLGFLQLDEIVQFIRAIPNHVTELNLSDNELGTEDGDTIHLLCRHMPEHITSLDLNGNILLYADDNPKEEFEKIKEALSTLPKTLKHLDLSSNIFSKHFSKKNAKNLLDSLSSLETIRFVLNCKGIFSYLPPSIHLLDLSRHYFEDWDEADSILAAIHTAPPTVTALDLSDNGLLLLSSNELANLFSGLPENISTLKLQGVFSHLEDHFIDQLKPLAHSLPHIKTIYLNCTEVKGMSFEERDALKALFPNIEKVVFADADMHRRSVIPYYRWVLGDKSAPPLLVSQLTFFIKNKLPPQSVAMANLPI